MFRIELQSKPAIDALQELIDRGSNLAPVMHAISEAMLDSIQQAFADEADPVSRTPWAPLSAISIRQRGGDAHPILQRTGRLAASFQQNRSSGNDFAEVGSNAEYALVQQLGAKQGEFGRGTYKTRRGTFPIPWGDIPARPMAGFSDELEGEILDIMSRYLTEAG